MFLFPIERMRIPNTTVWKEKQVFSSRGKRKRATPGDKRTGTRGTLMILMGPSQFKIFSVSNVCVAIEVLTTQRPQNQKFWTFLQQTAQANTEIASHLSQYRENSNYTDKGCYRL